MMLGNDEMTAFLSACKHICLHDESIGGMSTDVYLTGKHARVWQTKAIHDKVMLIKVLVTSRLQAVDKTLQYRCLQVYAIVYKVQKQVEQWG